MIQRIIIVNRISNILPFFIFHRNLTIANPTIESILINSLLSLVSCFKIHFSIIQSQCQIQITIKQQILLFTQFFFLVCQRQDFLISFVISVFFILGNTHLIHRNRIVIFRDSFLLSSLIGYQTAFQFHQYSFTISQCILGFNQCLYSSEIFIGKSFQLTLFCFQLIFFGLRGSGGELFVVIHQSFLSIRQSFLKLQQLNLIVLRHQLHAGGKFSQILFRLFFSHFQIGQCGFQLHLLSLVLDFCGIILQTGCFFLQFNQFRPFLDCFSFSIHFSGRGFLRLCLCSHQSSFGICLNLLCFSLRIVHVGSRLQLLSLCIAHIRNGLRFIVVNASSQRQNAQKHCYHHEFLLHNY